MESAAYRLLQSCEILTYGIVTGSEAFWKSASTMANTPPLAWLRAFEAAARHLSFKHAAAELHVSPSTISHQVRDLEAALGHPLFDRSNQQIRLTEEGAEMIGPISKGFELIRTATEKPRGPRSIKIGTFPFLGSEVLLPATNELKDRLNVAQVVVQTSTELSRLIAVEKQTRLDAVVKYGPPDPGEIPFAGYLAKRLFPIQLVPICSSRITPPDSLEALLALPQIKLIGPFDAWRRWSQVLGQPVPDREYVLQTDNYHAALLAVERGEGACLGVFPFLQTWLQAKRIHAMTELGCTLPESAYLVYAHHNAEPATIDVLADWLRARLT